MIFAVDLLLGLQVIFLIGFFLILAYIAFIMFSFRNIVPYVPTSKKIIKIMIDLAEIKQGERLSDLGSGTGRIIIETAKRHKKNMIVGIEKSFVLRQITKLKLFFHPSLRQRISVINQDFFNTDFYNLDVIFCFLTPEALRILSPKFQQLKSGSRIVSHMFPLEEHANFEESMIHVTAKDSIYVYKKL